MPVLFLSRLWQLEPKKVKTDANSRSRYYSEIRRLFDFDFDVDGSSLLNFVVGLAYLHLLELHPILIDRGLQLCEVGYLP